MKILALVTLASVVAACSADEGGPQLSNSIILRNDLSKCHLDAASTTVCSENGNAALVIADAEIKSLEISALQGSGESALRLGNYYLFVKNDTAKGNFWITISAEDNYSVGMYSLGAYLSNRSYLNDENEAHNPEVRARFWLERAKAAGYQPAKDLLDLMKK